MKFRYREMLRFISNIGEERAERRTTVKKTKSSNLRWLRLYQLIACFGIAAVLIPIFETLAYWIAKQYAAACAIVLVPILLLLGYGIQTLFLIGSHSGTDDHLDYSYESERKTVSPPRKWVAWLFGGVVGMVVGVCVRSFFVSLLGEESNTEVGFPLLLVACVLTAVGGCILKPFQFHQILSLRTMIGCIFVFSAMFAFRFIIGTGRSVNFLFVACFVVYVLCLGISMNQEYVTKPCLMYATCHATARLRWAGILSVLKLLGLVILFQIPVLASVSFVVIPFRAMAFKNWRQVFQFPIANAVVFNLILYLFGFVLLAAGIVWIFVKTNPKMLKKYYDWFRDFLQRIRMSILLFLKGIFGKDANLYFYPTQPIRMETRHYVDTVTFVMPKKVTKPTLRYSSFCKQLKAFKTEGEKFCFAYRILVEHLCASDIGIKRTMTPLEMVKTVQNRTNIRDFENLTNLFIAELYGEIGVATQSNVSEISNLLHRYME